MCETFQLGVAVHSLGELGIQLATMLHLGAVIPNLSFAADAHYHHLTDDIIDGGLMPYVNGAIKVPDKPGLGVTLNREKLREYNELYKRLGGYAYDQDPGRPGWSVSFPTTGGPIPKTIARCAFRRKMNGLQAVPFQALSKNRIQLP